GLLDLPLEPLTLGGDRLERLLLLLVRIAKRRPDTAVGRANRVVEFGAHVDPGNALLAESLGTLLELGGRELADELAIEPQIAILFRKEIAMDDAARFLVRLDSDKARHRVAKRYFVLRQRVANHIGRPIECLQ